MVIEEEIRLFRWSYSVCEAYNTCPRKYYEVKIAKNFQDSSEHATWGNEVHKALELAVSEDKPLPNSMSSLSYITTLLKTTKAEIYTELKLGVDENLQPVNFREGWCVGICDLVLINKTKATILDYKTGKKKLTNQLDILAMLVFQNFPHVQEISAGFLWIQYGGELSITRYFRNQVETLIKTFKPTLDKLVYSHEINQWPCKPSGLCKRHCPVRSCQYNGNYERKSG